MTDTAARQGQATRACSIRGRLAHAVHRPVRSLELRLWPLPPSIDESRQSRSLLPASQQLKEQGLASALPLLGRPRVGRRLLCSKTPRLTALSRHHHHDRHNSNGLSCYIIDDPLSLCSLGARLARAARASLCKGRLEQCPVRKEYLTTRLLARHSHFVISISHLPIPVHGAITPAADRYLAERQVSSFQLVARRRMDIR